MAENNTSGQKMLKVTLVKSPIRSRGVDKDTVRTLGLRKIRQSHTLPDNPAVRGMIFSVKHLVSVEEV